MSEPKKVLIIDDDADYVAAIRALLESSGYAVLSASNGRDGIEEAKVHRPDVVLLDVMMTERTEGVFALQEFRRIPELAKTPVVVISSIYADQPIFRVSPEAGWLPADLFLPKPVDPARLLDEIRRLSSDDQLSEPRAAAGRRNQ